MIKCGTLLKNTVKSADVVRADMIWGKDIASMKAKTTCRTPMQVYGVEDVKVSV